MLQPQFSTMITNVQGTEEGCIRAESSMTNIILYRIPRQLAENLLSEQELKRPGIYFFVKESVPSIYVGQGNIRDDGNGVLKRMLATHAEGVDDWDVAFVLISGTPTLFGATELNWLERYFYDKAKATGRYKVLYSVRPGADDLRFDMRGTIAVFTESAELVLRRDMGLYALEPMGSKKIPASFGEGTLIGTQLTLSAPRSGVYALGVLTGYKSIYVFPGATVGKNQLDKNKSTEGSYKLRKKLEEDGVIAEGTFVNGYEFSSPSQAAAVILGSNKSGNEAWRDKSGKNLGALLEPESSIPEETVASEEAEAVEEATTQEETSIPEETETSEEAETESRKKRGPFMFSLADIPIGATIAFKDDPSKTAIVVGEKTVEYEGRVYRLSNLAQLLTGKDTSLQGPRYFTYQGEILNERRLRLEG